MKFVLVLFVTFSFYLALVSLGVYCLFHGHPVAGGWIVAIGLLSMCSLKIHQGSK